MLKNLALLNLLCYEKLLSTQYLTGLVTSKKKKASIIFVVYINQGGLLWILTYF